MQDFVDRFGKIKVDFTVEQKESRDSLLPNFHSQIRN